MVFPTRTANRSRKTSIHKPISLRLSTGHPEFSGAPPLLRSLLQGQSRHRLRVVNGLVLLLGSAIHSCLPSNSTRTITEMPFDLPISMVLDL
jgi:hypothetical protein